eukprot:CAMPEP_0179272132 /NCGR_PEP_ID=MMETSP0797-20121207/32336_1 /TAXON_ID=47934 /ORGANISM="Dinophysis acuminata, Strain DAEP01" /LENGTH=85 /DNA_ID=CAMNT_0020980511 /DNA_START=51 /DNA_END=306 /DNA_ORIENTATION=+
MAGPWKKRRRPSTSSELVLVGVVVELPAAAALQLALLREVVREDRELGVAALVLQAVVVQAGVRPAVAAALLRVEVQDRRLRVLA